MCTLWLSMAFSILHQSSVDATETKEQISTHTDTFGSGPRVETHNMSPKNMVLGAVHSGHTHLVV